MNAPAIYAPARTRRQRAYIGWLATPSCLRTPDTELALSKSLGVRLSTLIGWRELPGFMRAVRKVAREALGQRYADVLYKLEEEAINGSLQHLKLYLELFEQEAIDDAAPEPNVKVVAGIDLARVGRAATPAARGGLSKGNSY